MSQSQRKNEDLIQRADSAESDAESKSTARRSKSASMPRSLSLKNRERIRKLFRSAKRRSGTSLTVFYRICLSDADKAHEENSPAKWLVAVPKRTGNAVKRNKIRRALRETIRLWPNRNQIAGEIIVRFEAPRKRRQKDATEKLPAALDKNSLRALREELSRALEDVYLGLTRNR